MVKLDWGNIWISIKTHKRLLLTIIGCALLLIFLIGTFQSCGNWFDARYIQKRFEGINAAQANANQVNANLANLKIQEDLKANEVNQLEQDLKQARNALNEARNATDSALENVNKAENGNFNNTNMTDAEKARCRAFPERCR